MFELEEKDYENGMRSLAVIAGRGSKFPAPRSGIPSIRSMNVCVICGNMWPKGEVHPGRCPSCRSTVWDRYDMHRHFCKACSYRWVSDVEKPERCPSCHTRNWNADLKRYECFSCGHKVAYGLDKKCPSECPKCGSYLWGWDKVSCSCRRCGFVGNLLPRRSGKCPLCGTRMTPDSRAESNSSDRVMVDSKAVGILLGEPDECRCITDLMSETGATEVEARTMFMLFNGSSELDAARELNVSFDYARRVSVALVDSGAVRGEADAPI